jgi:hypothetical protein
MSPQPTVSPRDLDIVRGYIQRQLHHLPESYAGDQIDDFIGRVLLTAWESYDPARFPNVRFSTYAIAIAKHKIASLYAVRDAHDYQNSGVWRERHPYFFYFLYESLTHDEQDIPEERRKLYLDPRQELDIEQLVPEYTQTRNILGQYRPWIEHALDRLEAISRSPKYSGTERSRARRSAIILRHLIALVEQDDDPEGTREDVNAEMQALLAACGDAVSYRTAQDAMDYLRETTRRLLPSGILPRGGNKGRGGNRSPRKKEREP